VRFVWQTDPVAQVQVPPQPLLPHVPGMHAGEHAPPQSSTGVPCMYPTHVLVAVFEPDAAVEVAFTRMVVPAATAGEAVPVKRR
jgi:hypothetical protein